MLNQFHVLTKVAPGAVSVTAAVDYVSAQIAASRLCKSGMKAGVLVTTAELRELARRSCNGAVAIAVDGEPANPLFEPLYELAEEPPPVVGGWPLLDQDPTPSAIAAAYAEPKAIPAGFAAAPPPAALAMPTLRPVALADWNRPSVIDRLLTICDWIAARVLLLCRIF